jgi:biotin carboxyl carrier protein
MKSVEVITDYPGVLSNLHVEDGAAVEEGDRLADIELMKTMFPIVAPASGVVSFRISLGQVVGEGDVIAVISRTK